MMIEILCAAGGAVTHGLLWYPQARKWDRMRDRLEGEKLLADKHIGRLVLQTVRQADRIAKLEEENNQLVRDLTKEIESGNALHDEVVELRRFKAERNKSSKQRKAGQRLTTSKMEMAA